MPTDQTGNTGKHSDDYMASMAGEARVLRHSRMIPMNGKLTDEHRQQVRDAFTTYTSRQGVSNSAVAKQIGFSPSVISQWLSGSYRGDVDTVTRKVNAWIERDARARAVRIDLPYVPTKIAEDMRVLAQLAHADGCMAAIVAPSGCGKTKVLKFMAESMNGFYLYCDEDLTPRTFLSAVAKLVGATVKRAAVVAEMKAAIIEKLRGSRRPIFLDEAHLLRRDVFSRIRSLHDQTGCPIIMAGTDEILQRIDDRAGGRGQMHSRCIMYDACEQILNVDDPRGSKLGRPLFSREEIKAMFEAMPVKLDPGAFEMIWAIACLPGYGCLRSTRRILDLAYRKWADKPLTRDDIQTVMNLFFGQRARRITNLADEHIQIDQSQTPDVLAKTA